MKKIKVAMAFNILLAMDASSAECQVNSVAIDVNIQNEDIIRSYSPKELFGFNVPWKNFQASYMQDGVVSKKLIDYMKAFPGAAYRFPGGSPSNEFEWRKSIGPLAARPSIYAELGQFAKVKFGVDEYVQFVKNVDGHAIYTLNLRGPHYGTWSLSKIATDINNLIQYLDDRERFGCIGGTGCRLKALELGNELDWSPFKYSINTYINRANAVLDKLAAYSDIVWVANGATAPWGNVSNHSVFNSGIAASLANRVHGISLHPYYDGISIPSVGNYINEYASTWKNYRKDGAVYITEHARWPDGSNSANWSNYWYQGTGLAGAISTSDFIVSAISNPDVALAAWHALSAYGPWKLIKVDEKTKELYPSPVYWGLRVLRDAYLDHAVRIQYNQPKVTTYGGGYDINMVAMVSDDHSKMSVLGINRNSKPVSLSLHWSTPVSAAESSSKRWITSDTKDDDNSDSNKKKIVMQQRDLIFQKGSTGTVVCMPAHSVFSIMIQ